MWLHVEAYNSSAEFIYESIHDLETGVLLKRSEKYISLQGEILSEVIIRQKDYVDTSIDNTPDTNDSLLSFEFSLVLFLLNYALIVILRKRG